MGYFYALLVLVLVAAISAAAILSAPPARLASILRATVPVASVLLGAILALAGRVGIGFTMAGLGVIWYLRNRGVRPMRDAGTNHHSTVRSALLEMELDHDSGDMDGVVLTGAHEGKRLSGMSESDLGSLFGECDDDSRQLLEAYLDRRAPGWRQHAKPDEGAGKGGAPRSGAMTKEEAYQILGLAPGAGSKQIREAHRRLMKRVHPDHGGSTFLAARINEAKDHLLD